MSATTGSHDLDYEAIKQVQQRIWSAGDFALVASKGVIAAEQLCEVLDIIPGERVLDVACGSGNATLAAARRAWDRVVGVDYVPELLEHARTRAEVERLEVELVEGDAEQLPFEDASFDVVISVFGVMFAPDQERAAAELLRVCRPGGRIGLASWTPEGMVGQAMRAVGQRISPPPGVAPPMLWGVEEHVRRLLGDGVSSLTAVKRQATNRFRSTDHFLEFFRNNFGPVKVAMELLDDAGREALAAEVSSIVKRFDRTADHTLVAPGEYLEVVADRA